MKKRNYRLLIDDMVESMDRIEHYLSGLSYYDFLSNQMVIDAVLRNIEIIGEAARNIPENIRNDYQIIPWKRMIGLRNIATHVYFGIDYDILWKILTEGIPEAKKYVLQLRDLLSFER